MKIDYLLKESKKEIKKVKEKMNTNFKSDTKLGNKKEDFKMFDLITNRMFPEVIKPSFITDIHYKDEIQKCVKNAFKENKYKQKLYEYLKEKVKNKEASFQDMNNYECFEKLDEDLEMLDEIFNVISEGLSVVREDIEKEIYSSMALQELIITLITRLSQLYNIYGFYLEDINCLVQYTMGCNLFGVCIKELSDIYKYSEKKGDVVNE